MAHESPGNEGVPRRGTISRRSVLLAGAGGLFLAACGPHPDDQADRTALEPDAAGEATTTTGPPDAEPQPPPVPTESGLVLARVFATQQPVDQRIRLPLVLADREGNVVGDLPDDLAVRVGPDGGELGRPTTVPRHGRGIPQPYFPLEATFGREGTWRIVADHDGVRAETTIKVVERADLPAGLYPGDLLRAIPTPTFTAPLGVQPICTADPVCPLHRASLDEARERGQAIALLVTSPAFCPTGNCGPVLDLLSARRAQFAGSVTMIHAEVFTDATATTTTDVVDAYGLPFDSTLILVAGDGTVVDRLDYAVDAVELDEALTRLADAAA